MTTEKKGATKNIVSTPVQQTGNNVGETQSNENAIDVNAKEIEDLKKSLKEKEAQLQKEIEYFQQKKEAAAKENSMAGMAMPTPIRDKNKIYATKGKLRSSFTKREWDRMGDCGWTEEVETPPEVLALK